MTIFTYNYNYHLPSLQRDFIPRFVYLLVLANNHCRIYSWSNETVTAEVYSTEKWHSCRALRAFHHELHKNIPLQNIYTHLAAFYYSALPVQQCSVPLCTYCSISDKRSRTLYPNHPAPMFTPYTVERNNFFRHYRPGIMKRSSFCTFAFQIKNTSSLSLAINTELFCVLPLGAHLSQANTCWTRYRNFGLLRIIVFFSTRLSHGHYRKAANPLLTTDWWTMNASKR